MNEMHEAVPLPDPEIQPLLHPLDVPEAAVLYRRGWWFGRLCSVPLAVAVGAVVWLLSGSVIAAVLAPLTLFVVGLIARRWFLARAWDYIPRKRRRTDGAPTRRLWAAAIDAVALVIAAAAFASAAVSAGTSSGVGAFVLGAASAVAVVQLGEILLLARRGRAMLGPRVILLLGAIMAILVAVLRGLAREPEAADLLPALIGAGTVFAAQLLWWVSTRVRAPRGGEEGA